MKKEYDLIVNEDDEKSVSLKEFIDRIKQIITFLLRRKKRIGVYSFCIALIVATVVFFSEKMYVAHISFGIDESATGKQNTFSKYAGLMEKFSLAGDFNLNTNTSLITPANLPILFQAQSIIYRVLTQKVQIKPNQDSMLLLSLWLTSYPQKENQKIEDVFQRNLDKPFGLAKERDSLFQTIYKVMDIEKSDFIEFKSAAPGSSVFKLTVRTTNELLTHFFASLLLKEVTDYYIKVNTKRITNQINYLEEQLAKVSKEYFGKLQNSISKNLPNLNSAIYYTNPQLVSDHEELLLEQSTFSSLLSNLQSLRLEQQKESPIFFILDNSVLPLKIEKLSTIKAFIVGFILSACAISFFWLVLQYFQKAYYNKPY